MAAPHAVERPSDLPRRSTRHRIETLVYANLGPDNGGFPLNVSEQGMAFQGVRPLELNQTIDITFKLPGLREFVSGSAEIVWLNESRKAGGLRFVDLPEESRRLITNWLYVQNKAAGRNENSTNLPVPGDTPKLPSSRSTERVMNSADVVPHVGMPKPSYSVPITEAIVRETFDPIPVDLIPADLIPSDPIPVDPSPIYATPEITSDVKTDLPEPSVHRPSRVPSLTADVPNPPPIAFAEVAKPPQLSSVELPPLPEQAPLAEESMPVQAPITEQTSPPWVLFPETAGVRAPYGDLTRSSPALFPVTGKVETKYTWNKSLGLGLVLGFAISIATMIICGVTLWHFRAALLPLIENNNVAKSDLPPAIDPVPAYSSEQAGPIPSTNTQQNVEANPLPPIVPPAIPVTMPPTRSEQQHRMAAPQVSLIKRNWSHPIAGTSSTLPGTSQSLISPAAAPQADGLHAQASGISTGGHEQAIAPPTNPTPERLNSVSSPESAPTRASSVPVKVPDIPVMPAGSVEIIADPYPSMRVSSEWKERPSDLGISLDLGRLVSKAAPQYPAEALSKRIEGKVKLHVVISRYGSVQSAQRIDGPAVLADAALRAVQQWRYEPTILGGEAIETEQDITMVFRLANPMTTAK